MSLLNTINQHIIEKKNYVFFEKRSSDLETPVSVYAKLRDVYAYTFLYESVEKAAGRGRYSIIACNPSHIWRCDKGTATVTEYDINGQLRNMSFKDDVIQSLRTFHKDSIAEIPSPLPSVASGLFGYFAYDMVRYFEKLPPAPIDTLNIPDAFMMRPQIVLIFDSVYDTLYAIHSFYPDGSENAEDVINNTQNLFKKIWDIVSSPNELKLLEQKADTPLCTPHQHMSKEEYEAIVEKCVEYIYAGDAFQIVPSQRFSIDFTADSLELYRHLRHVNPSPYMFHADFKDFSLVGASPEILVRAKDNEVTIRPIAGTRPRGKTDAEDKALEKDLLSDPKECAEHLMLLDLGRNDTGRVSQIGTVKVTEEFVIERYSHVMHIVSNVTGQLKENYDFLDALFSALPAGTVSGAPKVRAMEIINELEPEKRGFYGGGIGYFSANGDGDFALMLRTGLVKDGKFYIQAGAGVVADSVPENEYIETINKAGALVKAASYCQKS